MTASAAAKIVSGRENCRRECRTPNLSHRRDGETKSISDLYNSVYAQLSTAERGWADWRDGFAAFTKSMPKTGKLNEK
jgi:hypothetical protein